MARFPPPSIEVGRAGRADLAEAFGRLTFDAGAPPATPDTIFDLASLTKVIATTSLAMRQHGCGDRLALETRRRATAVRMAR